MKNQDNYYKIINMIIINIQSGLFMNRLKNYLIIAQRTKNLLIVLIVVSLIVIFAIMKKKL